MKQALLLAAVTIFLAVRSIIDPFWGAFLYYAFAVLRPQAIWEWALPQGVRWSLIAAIIALLALAVNAGSLGRRVTGRGFLALVVLFSLCLLGSYVGAINRDIAGQRGWEYAKILIMILVGSFVLTRRRHFLYLGVMIFVCLTYLVYEVNYLYVFDKRLDIYHRGYSGLDNNGAALMLAMVIPFCYHFFQAERRIWRWGFLLCAVPAAHAIMLSYSRGAMLAGLVAGGGMLLASTRRWVQTTVVAGVFGLAVLGLAGAEVRARFFTIKQEERDASAQSRLDSWRAGLKIARDYPLFGCGIRNSNLLTQTYGADREGRTIHNVYIQVAADAGIPAAVIYVCLIAFAEVWLWRGARLAKSRLDDREGRWHQAVCQAAFWSLFTFAFGSVFLSLEHFELPYLLMLMGAVAPGLAAEGRQAVKRTSQVASKAAVPATGGVAGPAS